MKPRRDVQAYELAREGEFTENPVPGPVSCEPFDEDDEREAWWDRWLEQEEVA